MREDKHHNSNYSSSNGSITSSTLEVFPQEMYARIHNKNPLILGPTGFGKSNCARYIASKLGIGDPRVFVMHGSATDLHKSYKDVPVRARYEGFQDKLLMKMFTESKKYYYPKLRQSDLLSK